MTKFECARSRFDLRPDVKYPHLGATTPPNFGAKLHLGAIRNELAEIAGLSELERNNSMDKTINYQQALLDEIKELPEEALANLLQIVRLFKESLLLQSHQAALALQAEFVQWDRLSDEALVEFEKDLS